MLVGLPEKWVILDVTSNVFQFSLVTNNPVMKSLLPDIGALAALTRDFTRNARFEATHDVSQ